MTTGSNSDRSAAGATLSASFTGATGIISETGFVYGTNSNIETLKSSGTKAYNTVNLTSSSGNFSKAITGLSGNTEYYYLAYVKEYNADTQAVETRYATSVGTIKKIATATVSTASPDPIGSNSATMKGSFSGATGSIHEAGIVYTTNASLLSDPDANSSSLSWANVDNCLGVTASGSISAVVTGLTPETTYYYKAFVAELNENTGNYEYRYGPQVSFTTTAAQVTPGADYLSGYGIPDLSSLNPTLRDQANARTDRDDYWYSYSTSNSKRQIAVHTYQDGAYNSEETLNYVILYDANNYAPLWTAHTMNNTYWPDNNVGRTKPDPWTTDPAISLAQISGLDDNSTYSRGHLVASDYRQTTTNQNKQTFYYTNKAPQYQDGFNGGVWQTLEGRVKTMTPSGQYTMLYVVTGVLYEESWYTANPSRPRTMSSGNKTVPIPSHFYKCIMKCTLNGSGDVTGAQGIAFVYPNVSHTGESYYDSSYVTSIRSIESRAGFNFFANVPDNYENDAENNTQHGWFTGVSNTSSVNDNNWGTL